MRRNRRFRNYSLLVTAVGLFFLAVLGLDPLFSGKPMQVPLVLAAGLVFAISIPFVIFYHMKSKSRE